jgi:hypothetical protein
MFEINGGEYWVDLTSRDWSKDQVCSSPFSRALIGGNPKLLGSGPHHHTPIRSTHPNNHRVKEKSKRVRSPEAWTAAGSPTIGAATVVTLTYAPPPELPATAGSRAMAFSSSSSKTEGMN